MQRYLVLDIFRTNEVDQSFIVSVAGTEREYYKIDKSLSDRVARGMVYIGDTIEVRELTDNGIIFTVLEANEGYMPVISSYSDDNFIYDGSSYVIKPYISPSVHFLPYLCDVMPYSSEAIEEVLAVPDKNESGFTGRYKVGNLYANNIKLPLSGIFIGRILHKTRINLYPNSFNPFFFIIISSGDVMLKVVFWIESLQKYSGLRVGDVIMVKEYRRKKKWAVFDKIDVNTFTESIYYDVEEVTAKELVKIKFDKKVAIKCFFNEISGRINYLSVLMRYKYNESLMEYVLLRVGDEYVVLFYNSDPEFYKIQVGTQIKISELRRMERATVSFLVSTIYTQFEIEDLPTEQSKKKKVGTPAIFGAIGFLPDRFKSANEITDYSHKELISKADKSSREISVNMFMRPVFISLSELKAQPLVLNESKKFMINSTITQITEVDCIVDYLENEENKTQTAFAVILDNQLEVFVYENFFVASLKDYPGELLKSREEELVGKTYSLIIEAFRTDEDVVIYYLTGIIGE